MSTSTTTNLGLVLDNADEPVKTHHRHANANLATLDVTIKSLQDSMENAKALLGQLGIDAEEHYVVDAETARATLDVPSLSDIDDIVRQNIPIMSPTTLGGAKLEEHGGLVLRDEKLGIGSLVQESDGAVRGGIAELTAKGHAEQDDTPTPDSPVEIQVVRGRNLLDVAQKANTTYKGYTYSVGANNRLIASGTATGTNADIDFTIDSDTILKSGETYTLSFEGIFAFSTAFTLFIKGVSWTNLGIVNNSYITFVLNDNVSLNMVKLRTDTGSTVNIDANIQLTLSSTPQPYVPYGHVGMEVRDANDQLLSTTPISLPSRGWVAGLPDGTADTLRIDGAGHVEWTLNDDEVVLDGSSDEGWFSLNDGNYSFIRTGIFSDVMRRPEISTVAAAMLASHFNVIPWNNVTSNQIGLGLSSGGTFGYTHTGEGVTVADEKAWLSTHPVTVLYPLATPVTEECGYIDPPSINGECQISIPELDALGVKYFVDDSVTEYGRQMYARAYAELGDAITELAARVAALES